MIISKKKKERKNMKRKVIYDLTQTYTKKNWLSIAKYFVLILIIVTLISKLLGLSSTLDLANELAASESSTDVNNALIITAKSPITMILETGVNALNSFLNAGLMFAVLRSYRENVKVTLQLIIEELSKKPFTIYLASLMIGLIALILEMIPILGGILSLVFTLASFFALLLLQENDTDPINAIKESLILSRGHKWNIMLIELKYSLLVLAAIILLIFLAAFGVVGLFLGIAILMLAALKTSPNLIASGAIYYDLLTKGPAKEEDVHF